MLKVVHCWPSQREVVDVESCTCGPSQCCRAVFVAVIPIVIVPLKWRKCRKFFVLFNKHFLTDFTELFFHIYTYICVCLCL